MTRCLRQEPPLCANDSSCPGWHKCCPQECQLRCTLLAKGTAPRHGHQHHLCPGAAGTLLLHPCPHPCAVSIATEQLFMRCWQPPAHGSQGQHGACGGVWDGARGRVQPGSDRGVWQEQVSWRCPRTPLVQPHLSAPCHSALQRNPVPARRQPPRGSFTPAPSPAWRTRTAWERRSAARWAVVLPAWSQCRVRPPQGPAGSTAEGEPQLTVARLWSPSVL